MSALDFLSKYYDFISIIEVNTVIVSINRVNEITTVYFRAL